MRIERQLSPIESDRLYRVAHVAELAVDTFGELAKARVGDRWLEAGKTAVLQVPSAVIPTEDNFLINPTHPRPGASG